MLYPKNHKLTKEDVVDCLLLAISEIPKTKLIIGDLTKRQLKRFKKAQKYLEKQDIYIGDK